MKTKSLTEIQITLLTTAKEVYKYKGIQLSDCILNLGGCQQDTEFFAAAFDNFHEPMMEIEQNHEISAPHFFKFENKTGTIGDMADYLYMYYSNIPGEATASNTFFNFLNDTRSFVKAFIISVVLAILFVLLFTCRSQAQPLVMIGISKNVVINYMDNQPGYERTTAKTNKRFATYISENDTITYHFRPNTLGMGHSCYQVEMHPVNMEEYINERLSTYRFVLEPYGYSLYTGYANDNVIRVLRNGNTLLYTY